MSNEQPRKHFALDPTVNISHILATLTMAASIFMWGNAMDRRMAVLEEKAHSQEKRDTQQDTTAASALLLLRADFADLRGEIRETNRKVERYIESNGTRKGAPQ
jgi:hypothetical protein